MNRFRCTVRGCPAIATLVDRQNGVLRGTLSKEHNHLPNPTAREAEIKRRELRNKVKENPRKKTAELLPNLRQGTSDELFLELGTNNALGKVIRR